MRVQTADKTSQQSSSNSQGSSPLTSCEVKSCVFVRNKSFQRILKFLQRISIIIHNIASFSKKVILSELREKYAQIKYRLQAKTLLKKQVVGFCSYRTTGDGLFHWRNRYYGLIFFKLKNLKSLDTNLWNGVLWITCGLLCCFYQLFGLSFWIICSEWVPSE